MSAKTKSIVRSFYDDVITAGDKSKLEKLCSPDLTFRTSLGQKRGGLEGISEHVDFLHTAVGGLLCEIDDLVSEKDRVFARITVSGTHQARLLLFDPTDNIVEWSAVAVFTFVDNKIVDIWTLGDVHGLIKQMADAAPLPDLNGLV